MMATIRVVPRAATGVVSHSPGPTRKGDCAAYGEERPVDQQYYRSSLSPGASLPLTPLIDVVFLIVVFFMVNATFAVHSAIPVQLPHADGDDASGSRALTITVDASGRIFIPDGGEAGAVTLDRLPSVLAALQPEGSISRVVLYGDAGARYGRLVAVMDVLRSAGVTDLNLVTAPTPAAP